MEFDELRLELIAENLVNEIITKLAAKPVGKELDSLERRLAQLYTKHIATPLAEEGYDYPQLMELHFRKPSIVNRILALGQKSFTPTESHIEKLRKRVRNA